MIRWGRGRAAALAALVAVAPALVFVPDPSAAQQQPPYIEVSNSCVAVGQRLVITVWGDGWASRIPQGGNMKLEWNWGGEPSTPSPADVTPKNYLNIPGTFAYTFDVNARATSFTRFNLVTYTATGIPTSVGGVDMNIQNTCPTATATCIEEAGQPVLRMQSRGYSSAFEHLFWYRYRTADQQGPATGVAQNDGTMVALLRNLRQASGSTVTARIYEPPSGDRSGRYYFLTILVPVCTVSSTTTAPTTTSPATTAPPVVTTTPTATTAAPGRTTLPPLVTTTTIVIPPPTPGATLTVTPAIGPQGFVATATGTGFPPGAVVVLTWAPGLGTASAVANQDGMFSAGVLVFPKDMLGPRTLVASGGDTSATATFLVVPGSVKPAGRGDAHLSRGRRFTNR